MPSARTCCAGSAGTTRQRLRTRRRLLAPTTRPSASSCGRGFGDSAPVDNAAPVTAGFLGAPWRLMVTGRVGTSPPWTAARVEIERMALAVSLILDLLDLDAMTQ